MAMGDRVLLIANLKLAPLAFSEGALHNSEVGGARWLSHKIVDVGLVDLNGVDLLAEEVLDVPDQLGQIGISRYLNVIARLPCNLE